MPAGQWSEQVREEGADTEVGGVGGAQGWGLWGGWTGVMANRWNAAVQKHQSLKVLLLYQNAASLVCSVLCDNTKTCTTASWKLSTQGTRLSGRLRRVNECRGDTVKPRRPLGAEIYALPSCSPTGVRWGTDTFSTVEATGARWCAGPEVYVNTPRYLSCGH